MNVADLQSRLRQLDPATPVHLLVLDRQGITYDPIVGTLDNTNIDIDTTGTVGAVWLTATTSDLDVPAGIDTSCECGERVFTDPTGIAHCQTLD